MSPILSPFLSLAPSLSPAISSAAPNAGCSDFNAPEANLIHSLSF